MKELYLIGGPMGVGKTAVGQRLKGKLSNSVFLDGDWCWDAHPFQVTEETKAMVLDNICHLLKNFIDCPAYDRIIFCWVMHQQSILDHILAALPLENVYVRAVSLICEEGELRRRLEGDIGRGLRAEDVVPRSLARLPLYEDMDTVKLDTTHRTVDEIVRELIALGASHGDE